MLYKYNLQTLIQIILFVFLFIFILFTEDSFFFLVVAFSNISLFLVLQFSGLLDYKKAASKEDFRVHAGNIVRLNQFLKYFILILITSQILFSGGYRWGYFSYWRLARDYTLSNGGSLLLILSTLFIIVSLVATSGRNKE